MKVTIEKVERLMDRADVGYEVAREALETANGDLLEAIIELEKDGKFGPNAGRNKPGSYSTSAGADPSAIGQSYGEPMLPQTAVAPNFTMAGDGTEAAGGQKPGKRPKAEKAEKKQAKESAKKQKKSAGQNGAYNQGGAYSQGGAAYKYKDETSDFEDNAKRAGNWFVRLLRAGVLNGFEVWRKGERIFYFPVILFLFCLIHWVFWIALILFVVGLFCGCRYRFSGPHLGRRDINGAMDKAADFAEEVKDGESPDN